jgi:hypothetical protein
MPRTGDVVLRVPRALRRGHVPGALALVLLLASSAGIARVGLEGAAVDAQLFKLAYCASQNQLLSIGSCNSECQIAY